MRVFIGLAALSSLAYVQAQTQVVTLGYTSAPVLASPAVLSGETCKITVFATQAPNVATPNVASGTNYAFPAGTPYVNINTQFGTTVTGGMTIPFSITAVQFQVNANAYTAQMQYRYVGSGGTTSYICDPCTQSSTGYTLSAGSASYCDINNGPKNNAAGTPNGLVNGAYPGYYCASWTRLYTYSNLAVGTNANAFSMSFYDNTTPYPDNFSVSFAITRLPSPIIVGDPQIVGMQGQDFQVHGMPDEIFNIVTYPTIQVNARFTYLESAECHDNYTACFAHPGTYISEEGFRLGRDKIRISAGSYKKGLTVSVNGKKTKSNMDLKSGAIELVNHRRVVIHTDVMSFTVTNSDKFLNQEIDLKDDKLVALGAERRALKDNERFHPEVPLHGLQGQTWRNVEYPSGLEYEGSIMDYHVVDGNLFGTDFVFNQFQA